MRGHAINGDGGLRRIHLRYRVRNTYGVDSGVTMPGSMRLLYRISDAVVPQHVAVVMRCHDPEVVSNGLLSNCHGHECGLFEIIIGDGRQRTIHERLWCKRSHLAGHAGEIRWALIGLSTLVAEPFRSLGLSLFKLVGSLIWHNIFLDDADF